VSIRSAFARAAFQLLLYFRPPVGFIQAVPEFIPPA
jgi:hypothetical protein